MTETPTQTSQPTDPFEDQLFMQKQQEAARRLIIEEAPAHEEHIEVKHDNPGKAVAAGIAAAAGVALMTGVAVQANAGPEFSEETKPAVIEEGDGLHDLAEQIEGIQGEDIRDGEIAIESLPVNIDPLKDGLQTSDSIEVPVKVEE